MIRDLFAVRGYPFGRILDVADTWEEARDIIAAYEEQDMEDCVYSVGRYYISTIPAMDRDLIDAVQRACTTSCLQFRNGKCPYRWDSKAQCPFVRRFLCGS